MAKTILLDEDEDWLDFYLYGIVARTSLEYQLVYRLNLNKSFHFQRKSNLLVNENEQIFEYISYEYKNPLQQQEYLLFKNQSLPSVASSNNELSLFEEVPLQSLLLKKHKKYNFILKSNSLLNEEILVLLSGNSMIQSINKIENIDFKEVKHLIS